MDFPSFLNLPQTLEFLRAQSLGRWLTRRTNLRPFGIFPIRSRMIKIVRAVTAVEERPRSLEAASPPSEDLPIAARSCGVSPSGPLEEQTHRVRADRPRRVRNRGDRRSLSPVTLSSPQNTIDMPTNPAYPSALRCERKPRACIVCENLFCEPAGS